MIVPTKHADVPVVPNFFLEAKAPRGGADVARSQACYNGAYGARAVHSLQNYGGEEEPVYDKNAYTYSSSYLDGQLKLYAHHVTAPRTPGDRPSYHITQVDTYALTGSRRGFVEGATAFRNARDMAQRHRDKIIREANARAHQPDDTQSNKPELVETQQKGNPGSDTLVVCEKPAAASGVTATDGDAVSDDPTGGSAPPQHRHTEDREDSHE